ncbi:MAG: tRNA 2-thiouridine(34) synthase MnmA [Candidatus Poribacteria bacterium]|nr:tRNA 2-thiouridine(34) synthase MnmA [Candidatus Poribacteria bacterium]
MSTKVIIAMSGGVDSSVTAALMVEAGYDVVAITMRLGMHDTMEIESDKPNCCSLEGVEDARRVAMQLGVPFYAVNYEDQFRKSIVDYFTDEYVAGRTPSPCVICNQDLKFGKLLDLAMQLEADYVATGHYARIEQDPETGRYLLRKGIDSRKDQSYFLFSLTQDQLSRALMPLGGYTKDRVREIARKYKLRTSEKPESQELCFIADDNYKRFLKDRIPEKIQGGEIISQAGDVLGKHQGIPFYTVGQRKGLGIAAGVPLYVTELKTHNNTIVVGKHEDLLKDTMRIEQVNLIPMDNLTAPIRAHVKIRYRDAGASATITPLSETEAEVQFDEPRRAVTPGQAAVFYDGDVVIGGGWIQGASER